MERQIIKNKKIKKVSFLSYMFCRKIKKWRDEKKKKWLRKRMRGRVMLQTQTII